jgi:hypothetical protein
MVDTGLFSMGINGTGPTGGHWLGCCRREEAVGGKGSEKKRKTGLHGRHKRERKRRRVETKND